MLPSAQAATLATISVAAAASKILAAAAMALAPQELRAQATAPLTVLAATLATISVAAAVSKTLAAAAMALAPQEPRAQAMAPLHVQAATVATLLTVAVVARLSLPLVATDITDSLVPPPGEAVELLVGRKFQRSIFTMQVAATLLPSLHMVMCCLVQAVQWLMCTMVRFGLVIPSWYGAVARLNLGARYSSP
jgi:hypothetical protein